jgi:hypothetical protein
MRQALIVLCIFTAACSSQTVSPASPSGIAAGTGGPTQASAAANVEVTFTKWFTGVPAMFPPMAGVTGGDVPGTFVGELRSRVPFDNGTITQLEARYEVKASDPAHSFVALIEGKTNNPTQHAVLNGTVIDGWLVGARVHVTFDVIVPPTGTSCVPEAPVDRNCFRGTIRVMPGSAN